MAECRIKFFVADYRSPEVSGYQHELIALAEGFEELDLPFVGNCNYWMDEDSGKFLIHSDGTNKALEINIFHERFLVHYSNWIDYVDLSKTNILIDSTDGFYSTPCHDKKIYQAFDLILKTHYSERMYYPKNVVPWAFGLTNRIIKALDRDTESIKDIQILNNFSPNLSNHNVRAYLNKSLDLNTNLKIQTINSSTRLREFNVMGNLTYWAQTGKRHDEAYYSTLNKSKFTLSYGGFFSCKLLNTLHNVFGEKTHSLNAHFYSIWKFFFKYTFINKQIFINQFDSYRLWEVFYSQSIPVTLAFREHGFILPEVPIAGKHYFPIYMKDKGRSIELAEHLSLNEINTISKSGRNWAYEFYSPSAVAKRLLGIINF